MTALYQELLTPEFFEDVKQKEQLRENNSIYTLSVVMWLMMVQRLQGKGTLQTAVLEVLGGLPKSFWPRPCKRLLDHWEAEKRISCNTGAYNKARQGLPLAVVEQSFDAMFEQLTRGSKDSGGELAGRQAFCMDGTTVRLENTAAIVELYPPASNQLGDSHWPVIRMIVAHDLHTGIAMRPHWGPMNGKQAVSEQKLLEEAIDRLPKGSLVMGDSNFGVFSVAYAADQRKYPVLLRLTASRAKHLVGGEPADGMDLEIAWMPSRDDRRSHPDLPPDACVRGRLMVRRVEPSDGSEPFLLSLFTTLELGSAELVQFYGKRWNIETDLRSLKASLQLDQLTSTTPEMVAKEIDLGWAAYNLVRAIAYQASQKAGIPPRSFSFTQVKNIMNTFSPLIAAAKTEAEARRHYDTMMYYVGQAKLPKRRKKRPSYPRTVWHKPRVFPKKTSSQ